MGAGARSVRDPRGIAFSVVGALILGAFRSWRLPAEAAAIVCVTGHVLGPPGQGPVPCGARSGRDPRRGRCGGGYVLSWPWELPTGATMVALAGILLVPGAALRMRG